MINFVLQSIIYFQITVMMQFHLKELKLDITNSPFFLFPKSFTNFPKEVKICLSFLVSSFSISFALVKVYFTQRFSIFSSMSHFTPWIA